MCSSQVKNNSIFENKQTRTQPHASSWNVCALNECTLALVVDLSSPPLQTFQASSGKEVDVHIKVERGDVRIGMISEAVLLGENWCSTDKVGKVFYLDAYFGVIRTGDQ